VGFATFINACDDRQFLILELVRDAVHGWDAAG